MGWKEKEARQAESFCRPLAACSLWAELATDPERTRELWFLEFISCRQKSICWKTGLWAAFKSAIDVDELAWERESSQPCVAWLTCWWAVLGPHRKALWHTIRDISGWSETKFGCWSGMKQIPSYRLILTNCPSLAGHMNHSYSQKLSAKQWAGRHCWNLPLESYMNWSANLFAQGWLWFFSSISL